MSRSFAWGHGRKAFLPVVLAATAVLALVGAGSAPAGTVEIDDVVKARGVGENMHFDPRVVDVVQGQTVKVANRTNEPHTLSLVNREDVPNDASEINGCFFGICGLIFEAHKKEKPGPGFGRIVRSGAPGFQKSFELPDVYGDSVFFHKQAREITVTDQPGTTQWFICALHPWMHGRFEVANP